LLRRTIGDSFREIDVLVLPTRRRSPRTVEAALKREESDKPRNPEMENTGQFNILGLPAISIPCGFTSAGLPIGLQIVGAPFADSRVLALAHAFERVTEFHKRKPPITPDTPVPKLVTEDN
jgi:aspartyl-tRNA(Asn)/glutamyl-tRNA(Gln) amidotransferase subunit A